MGDRGKASSHRAPARASASVMVALGFLAVGAAAVLAGKLPTIVLVFYLVASAAAFVAYLRDKRAALHKRWRTPESTLHLFSLVGGWPGALLAQGLLRHKSKKASFQIAFWCTVVINCGALAWLLSSSGWNGLRTALGSA